MMKRFIFIVFILIPCIVGAKNPTISGYVLDIQTGERLIGATVVDKRSGVGTVTNVNGFYSLTLPSAEVLLQASYVGYDEGDSLSFTLRADTLVELSLVSTNVLAEVVVEAAQSVSGIKSWQKKFI